MNSVRIQEAASLRLDEIYRYTRDKWSEAQAGIYIIGLFDSFNKTHTNEILSRPIPAELHERMHQFDRFADDGEL